MRINRTTFLISPLLIILIVGLYLINKVSQDSIDFNENCISDSSYLKPNVHFLLAPIDIKEIRINGKIIYPTDLTNEDDSFMVGRNEIFIKLIDGKIIMDSICLEIDCLSYDIVITDSLIVKFEPSTYD